LEHILFECLDSGHETIWGMARVFLRHKHIDMDMNIGLVLGCASAPADRFMQGISTARAFSIVVSESAFLAWKIRCEKRMEHRNDPEWRPNNAAVSERWQKMMRRRVSQDFRLTDARIFGRKALKRALVHETW
ncbi:hypothetical protein AURDEDRAFT_24476, partial [Auricularia subglabra TFB-10046 SS5]